MDPHALDLAIARAWPARERVAPGSWTARLDGGVTRRSNSVLPHGAGRPPPPVVLDRMLDRAVEPYTDRRLTPWIQVTGAVWPPSLAADLEARGWETGVDRTLLLTGALPPPVPRPRRRPHGVPRRGVARGMVGGRPARGRRRAPRRAGRDRADRRPRPLRERRRRGAG